MDTTHTPTTTLTLTTYLAQAAVLAKVAKKAAGDAYAEAEADAIAAMTADGVTTVELPDDTLVTVVRPERMSVDVDALAEVLPAAVLDKVTTTVRVIDPEALAAAVKVGTVAPSVVEAATKRSDAKPTLRITARPKNPVAR